jgi:3-methyladenine DNA glycosylase Tag
MTKFAIELVLYNEDGEPKTTCRQSFVPFRLLKEAVKIQSYLENLQDPKNLSQETIDNLGDFVVAFFGNKFSREELMDGAELSDVVTVIKQIVAKLNGDENPTPPPAE